MLRVGVDTGGTFTDLVWLAEGRRRRLKVPSTPDDPSRAVLEGLRRLLAVAGEPGGGAGEAAPPAGAAGGPALPPGSAVVHGSTVATNALLEGKVAPVALLTNSGFEDILAIGRQNRPDLYDASRMPPTPLVPARLRFGIPGRLGPAGEELAPLDAAAVRQVVGGARAAGVDRFAVCLLHAYANPAHEEAVGRLVGEMGGTATLSSRVLPEYREYERTSTTVVNAALEPVMTSYLQRLADSLPAARLSVFRSNGGILSAAAAGREAVQTLLSGPAAGVLGAWMWGRAGGMDRLITFDMGGTSTDVALIAGEPALTHECVVGGHPVRLPMIDIHTVGAGGGSLARVDAGGALVVGPESAGADPGPACYGRGRQATVTDAQVVLGRLPADRPLGGDLVLDGARARQAIGELAEQLGCGPEEAAAGVVQVADAGMARAVRVVSVARGQDPRDFALFCFGGAGGLHAADLAGSLGIRRVIVPPGSGTFSAYGMMTADVVLDASAAVLRPLADVDREARAGLAEPLAARLLAAMEGEGFAADRVTLQRSLDLRYRGQSYEINVPDGDDVAEAFHARHRALYEHAHPERPVELVTLRVRAVGALPPPGPEPRPPARAGELAAGRSLPVWFAGQRIATAFHERAGLQPGDRLAGPAVVLDSDATTAVPPGWQVRVDRQLNLVLEPATVDGEAP